MSEGDKKKFTGI